MNQFKLKLKNKKTAIVALFGLAAIIIVLCSAVFMSLGSQTHCMKVTGSTECHAKVLANIENPTSVALYSFIVILAFGLVTSLINRFLLQNWLCLANNYFRYIHQRLGSFRFFNYFTFLFSQGIVHPKTF